MFHPNGRAVNRDAEWHKLKAEDANSTSKVTRQLLNVIQSNLRELYRGESNNDLKLCRAGADIVYGLRDLSAMFHPRSTSEDRDIALKKV
jgi:predicted component of type VI protein secretion system